MPDDARRRNDRPADHRRAAHRGLRLRERPDPDAAAVVGPVRSDYARDPSPWVQAGRFFDRRRLPTGTPVEVAATNNLLLDLHEVRRHRPAQVGTALVHPDDAPPDKMRRKAATHRFHFWQFWHFPPIRCMVPP